MSSAPVWILFAAAVLTALSGLLRKKASSLDSPSSLLFLISALCTLAGLLTGLALGWTLEELIPPLLAVCAAAMAARSRGRGEGGP